MILPAGAYSEPSRFGHSFAIPAAADIGVYKYLELVTVSTAASSVHSNPNTGVNGAAGRPETGIDGNGVLWASLLLVLGGALAGLTVAKKRGKPSEK